jgi:hypothetical protein
MLFQQIYMISSMQDNDKRLIALIRITTLILNHDEFYTSR